MSEQGIIFNIQKFSIHDGPGVRTTVFLKGCPLRCKWCSNPESQLRKVQIMYDAKKCIHCHTCLTTCPAGAMSLRYGVSGSFAANDIIINQDTCTGCLSCTKTCKAGALTHEGDLKTVDEVYEICMQDIDFYEESDGGVTISGGEGMAQPDFAWALIRKLKESHVHTAIETTGCVSSEVFRRLAPQFDLLLFDVKHHDSEKHRTGTGVGNEQILDNLRWACEKGINVLPRIPVIPGFNASLEDARGLAAVLKDIGLKKAQLLPFHQMGEKKYEFLGREYELREVKALHAEDLKEYQNIFVDAGIDCII